MTYIESTIENLKLVHRLYHEGDCELCPDCLRLWANFFWLAL